MSKRDPALYLHDILTAIEHIEAYIEDMFFMAFEDDQRTIDAVVRNLEIIGEAARHIPQKFIAHHHTIPWEKMVSMRNKILHEYFGVDTEILWKTITEDIPHLKMQLTPLLQKQ